MGEVDTEQALTAECRVLGREGGRDNVLSVREALHERVSVQLSL